MAPYAGIYTCKSLIDFEDMRFWLILQVALADSGYRIF